MGREREGERSKEGGRDREGEDGGREKWVEVTKEREGGREGGRKANEISNCEL